MNTFASIALNKIQTAFYNLKKKPGKVLKWKENVYGSITFDYKNRGSINSWKVKKIQQLLKLKLK